jgi:hypothetical protein
MGAMLLISERRCLTDGTKGLLFGLAATLIGGIYTVFAQQAPAMGIDPFDLLAFRFSIAGVVLFPVFVKYGLKQNFAGLGLAKALVLCVFGGLGFVFFFFSGFQYAPLSHGAVIPAGMSAIFGAILAHLFRGEAFGRCGRALSICPCCVLSANGCVSGFTRFGAGAGIHLRCHSLWSVPIFSRHGWGWLGDYGAVAWLGSVVKETSMTGFGLLEIACCSAEKSTRLNASRSGFAKARPNKNLIETIGSLFMVAIIAT